MVAMIIQFSFLVLLIGVPIAFSWSVLLFSAYKQYTTLTISQSFIREWILHLPLHTGVHAGRHDDLSEQQASQAYP